MAETPVILCGDPFRLFGVLHLPDAPASGTNGAPQGFVFCAPFAEEKKGAHRLLVDTARELCARGIPVLRFDYRGTGDSEGAFTDFTLSGAVEDIRRAVTFLQEQAGVERVGLLGVRLGGALAALAGVEIGPAVVALGLWEPITNGRRYLQMNLRQKRIREMMTAKEGDDAKQAGPAPAGDARTYSHVPALPAEGYDFDGYWITPKLNAEIEALVIPKPVDGSAPARVLAVSINAAGRVGGELEALCASYRDAGAAAETAGVLAEPFWSLQDPVPVSELVRATADWAAPPAGSVGSGQSVQSVQSVLSSEEPIVFENHGETLLGVLCRPEAPLSPKTGIVTLHGWSGYRIGPHGILTDFARRAAGAGFTTLRFDFRGRGDSEGDMGTANRASMIDDAVRAVRYLREEVGCERVILAGMCAGSQVAVGAVAEGAGADAMLVWSAPVSEQAEEEKAVAAKRKHFLKEYAAKLFRVQTWRKLISGKLQPKKILKVVSGESGRASTDDRSVDLHAAARLADFAGPMLFIYGTHDPVTTVALPYYERILQARRQQMAVTLIEGANHSFYGTLWKEQVLARTLEWLREHFAS